MKIVPRWITKFSLNEFIRVGLGLALVVCFALDAAEWLEIRPLTQLERWAYDARVRLFLPRTPDPRMVIIDVDEKSLNAEGHWPWGRDKLALLVRQLFERYGVRVVAFDVAFPEADPSSGLPILEAIAKGELSSDAQFQAFLDRSRASLDYDRLFADEIGRRQVVLGFLLGSDEQQAGVLPRPAFDAKALASAEFIHFSASGYSGNLPLLQSAATATGHLSPALDPDGITRSVPAFVRIGESFYEAMALAVLRLYLGNAPVDIETTAAGPGESAQGWIRSVRIGDAVRIPLDYRMAALVPYRDHGSYRYVSATDVLRGAIAADQLKDRIALVGTSARGLVDVRATPIREDLPGVEVHASLISGALDNAIKSRPAEALAIAVLTILFVGLPLAVLLPRLSALAATCVVAVVLGAMLAANLWAWQARNLVLPIAGPLALLAALYVLDMVYGFFTETRHRRLITGLFGTYVPKEIVAEMAKNPGVYSMRGQSREMTVLFSDIRDFTSISEGLTPAGLKDLMNTYLTRMTLVVQQKRGTIDKYIGDAIMAFWGAPMRDAQHAKHALECGIEMQKALRTLDPILGRKGWPPLHIGVGLNCGRMSVGDMGSQFRRSYTVMGDAVNLASRLEGLTKEYGVGILVTENIVREAPTFVYREIDKVRVKGKLEGVAIFEPLGANGEVGAEVIEETGRFHQALAHYRKQRWDDAAAMLETLAQASPATKLYKLYVERVAHFRANPPGETWDGVFVFKTK